MDGIQCAKTYHLQQQFTPGSGVIEFIANHYVGMDYTRLAGPLPSSWITVVRLTILFQLPTFELSVLNWYAYILTITFAPSIPSIIRSKRCTIRNRIRVH